MLLVIHACIGMPMASLDCWKRFLDAHSISVKREYPQIEHLFVTDNYGSVLLSYRGRGFKDVITT